MAKQIIYGEEARKAIERGVNQLADTAGKPPQTLGMGQLRGVRDHAAVEDFQMRQRIRADHAVPGSANRRVDAENDHNDLSIKIHPPPGAARPGVRGRSAPTVGDFTCTQRPTGV